LICSTPPNAPNAHDGHARASTFQITKNSVTTGTSEMFVVESGSGIPVVFIHGLGWTHALWHQLIPVFAKRYRIIAADTRGHGRSAKPPGPQLL